MNWYPWVQAFHIVAVVCWFAGIFYLPRLFVYHATAEDQISRERFAMMEEKLHRIIMTPAMLASLVFGLIMLIGQWSALSGQAWLWTKFALVLPLMGYHEFCRRLMRELAAAASPAQQQRSEKFYRMYNEIPVLLLILIVILAVVKPF